MGLLVAAGLGGGLESFDFGRQGFDLCVVAGGFVSRAIIWFGGGRFVGLMLAGCARLGGCRLAGSLVGRRGITSAVGRFGGRSIAWRYNGTTCSGMAF